MNKQDIIIYKTTDDQTEVALYARDGKEYNVTFYSLGMKKNYANLKMT